MLKQLRKKENAKKVLWLLAIVIVPAFVLWGSSSLISSHKKENFAGKLFGKKISFEEFNDSLQAVKTQAVMQFGDNFYKIQKFLNLEAESWDRLILLHEARKHKIKVSDKEVVEAIKKYPFFQRDGKFDTRIYNDILTYSIHIPARIFEEQTRANLMFAKLFEEITQNVSINDSELINEYKKLNEKIKMSYLFASIKEFEKATQIDSASVNDYFEKHKQEFKRPISINIQYLGVDFADSDTPSQKMQLQNKIEEVSVFLAKEPDFEKASSKFNIPLKETGFFSKNGPIPAIGWSKEFLEIAFSLKPAQISKTIETPKGIYILRLKERKDSYIPGLAEAETQIKKILSSEKARDIAEKKANEALEKIRELLKTNKKADFAKLARALGLEVKQTPFFKYGDYIPDIGAALEFQDAAFNLKEAEDKISGIVSLPQGFYILRLDDFQGFEEKKFAQEKEEFKKALLDKKKKEIFNNFFEKLKKEAHLQDNISKMKLNL